MNRIARYGACLMLLWLARGANAQLQVTDDLQMRMNGTLTAGYEASYGDQLPSTHGLDLGGNAQLNGIFYDPNFLNFSVAPYYNQSRANSSFQSLTDSSGVAASANLFSGSRFPGFASYDYSRNSTGTFGLIGMPSFTTIGTTQGFGVGWSALLPNWPTLSVSYSQGIGNGTVFGTNEEANSATHTLNVRSTYQFAGWQLGALYTHLNISSKYPSFIGPGGGLVDNNFFDTSGANYGVNGFHALPWHGSIAITYNHSTYSGDYSSLLQQTSGKTDYTLNTETANAIFRPTQKLGLFASQSYTDNLEGYLYQTIASSTGGVPLVQIGTQSGSYTLSGGANYNFTKNLYGQAQITYFNQSYLGNTYDGSYFTGTVGYGKRILDIFTVSASIIENSNRFSENNLGFMGNLNGYYNFGPWETSGGFSYAQNVQTYLVTYTTSYYNYNANVHRRLGQGKQWTGAISGSHSGFSQQVGTVNHSEGFSTSLALRRFALMGNYVQSRGQSLLTSTGIQPITTPGLPPIGIIVYNGKSYGAGVTLNPVPRLTISGTYSRALSDTLNGTILSNNKSDILYAQLQYRLRQLNVLAGYTKFYQSISAAGTLPGNEYSYFVGVTRSFNFF